MDKQKISYLAMMQPYSNKVFKALFYRKLLPSFYSKKKIRLLLNLIRCEAHRDVLIGILKEKQNN
jgi:hypothetical protein